MAFQKGQSGNPGGRKPLTLSQRKALKLLQKGSPRAAARLLELVESEDPLVAMNAAKAVLSKTLADMKHVEQTGAMGFVVEPVAKLSDEDLRALIAATNAPTTH